MALKSWACGLAVAGMFGKKTKTGSDVFGESMSKGRKATWLAMTWSFSSNRLICTETFSRISGVVF